MQEWIPNLLGLGYNGKDKKLESTQSFNMTSEEELEQRKQELEAELEDDLMRINQEKREGLHQLDWELAEAVEQLHERSAAQMNERISQHREVLARIEARQQAPEDGDSEDDDENGRRGRRRSRSSSPGAASAHSNGTSHHESAAQGAFMEHVHQIGSAMASFFSGGSLGARGRGVDRRRNHSRDSGSSSSERDDEQSDHRGSFHESMHHQVPEERHKDLSSPPFEPLGPVPPRTSPTTSQNGFHGVAGASAAASPPQTESRLPKAYGSFLVISDRTYESPSAAQPGGQTPPAQATQPASFVLPSGKDPLGGSMRSLEAAHPASFEQFSGKDPLGGSMRNSEELCNRLGALYSADAWRGTLNPAGGSAPCWGQGLRRLPRVLLPALTGTYHA
eukprot:TRINITY_DN616_c0_g1_i2.p1 TRINITY_DN616_c0_g1~~TRINITY_DN616_c0_g1_i2.p1  ORF type:complete len:392 (-),score=74.64 TRINITY_DN616_c0_g1_i2:345-1520(-)